MVIRCGRNRAGDDEMKTPQGILVLAVLGVLAVGACSTSRVTGCEALRTCPGDGAGGQGGSGASTGGAGGGALGGGGGACDESCAGGASECDAESAGSTECVACTAESGCEVGVCDASRGRCVACLEDADCTEPGAARCDGGECVGCTEDAQCAGVDGRELCDVGTGECVECLPGEHDSCGAGWLCHGERRECVEAQAASAPTCGTCVADAHCKAGFRCVQPNLFGEEGYFCLPEADPECDTRRPFVNKLEDLVTIDGEAVTVCGHRFTSCAGFNHFSTAVDGCSEATDPPPTGEGNAACGLPGTADNTRCRGFGTGARCSYRCLSADDCPCGVDCVDQVCGFTPNAELCED